MKPVVIAAALASAGAALAQTTPSTPPVTTATALPSPAATPAAAAPMPPLAPVLRRHIPPSPAELRVRAANRAATLEPVIAGYINAVQVYPFSDGAVFHVFTAPGQVTDIALQPGEALGAARRATPFDG